MTNRLLFPLVLALGLTACGHVAPRADAPSSRTTGESTVSEVQSLDAIHAALAESGARRTLLVLDIDDTLLTSPVFFGSDRWYEWQKSLAAGDPGKVPCRFDVIALNYEAGTQQVTEEADVRERLNGLTVDRLILTARSPGYRAGTLRELRAARYALPPMLAGAGDGLLMSWRPAPSAAPVSLSYQDGVMMVAGQDKGRTLLALLDRLGQRYDRVVLADDGRHNIDHMQAALREAGIDYHGLWYRRVDKRITDADRIAGKAGWTSMRTWLQTVFPERLQRMEAGQCAY